MVKMLHLITVLFALAAALFGALSYAPFIFLAAGTFSNQAVIIYKGKQEDTLSLALPNDIKHKKSPQPSSSWGLHS